MPGGRISHPVHINIRLTPAQNEKLQRRADLQGISRGKVIEALVDQLPEPTPQPAPRGDEEE